MNLLINFLKNNISNIDSLKNINYNTKNVIDTVLYFLNNEIENEILRNNIYKLLEYEFEKNCYNLETDKNDIKLNKNINYTLYAGFLFDNFCTFYKDKKIVNLFFDFFNPSDRYQICNQYILDKELREIDSNINILNNMVELFNKIETEDKYKVLLTLHGEYLSKKHYSKHDIDCLNNVDGDIKITSFKYFNAKFIYNYLSFKRDESLPHDNKSKTKYEYLKSIYDFKNMYFDLYDNQLPNIKYKTSSIIYHDNDSFKVVSDDFLNINQIKSTKIIDFINEFNFNTYNRYNELIEILLKKEKLDLSKFNLSLNCLGFLSKINSHYDDKIKLEIKIESTDDIEKLVAGMGLFNIVLVLNKVSFDSKQYLIDYLSNNYKDEINLILKNSIETNDMILIDELNKYMILNNNDNNKIERRKRW